MVEKLIELSDKCVGMMRFSRNDEISKVDLIQRRQNQGAVLSQGKSAQPFTFVLKDAVA